MTMTAHTHTHTPDAGVIMLKCIDLAPGFNNILRE